MQLVRRFRIPALLCALAVLVCELISHPFAAMGISDDWPYILMAQKLAATGHIIYNGWATPILGWQLYLGAAFIKLFGFSLTTVRMSTLLVAMALAFFLQRTFVRAGINERNATIGTLALVLSPLYLMLSVTFMTDIQGLFAVVICLYGCLRALQSSTSRATIGWLCFAIVTNAICGTARQLAWLGILVMVPSTLWLLRARHRVLLAGAAATLAGALFVFGCMHWFQHQPYTQPESLFSSASFPVHPLVIHPIGEFIRLFLDLPFLLLPIMALFLPQIRRNRPRSIALIATASMAYIFLTFYLAAHFDLSAHGNFMMEPTLGDWVNVHGIYDFVGLKGKPPIFLHGGSQVLLTIASIGGLIGLISFLFHDRRTPHAVHFSTGITWKQLGVLLAPFTFFYLFLLTPRAITYVIFDRYALALLVVALLCLVRYYQDRIQCRLPFASVLLVGIMAIYGIVVTHNTFALYRARVAIAGELRANGVPDTSVDNGWEYNMGVELQHAAYINNSRILVPPNAYVPIPPLPAGTCSMIWYNQTPHIHPRYGISFDPNACYGLAPFTPVSYSRWLASKPGTLYVVNYTAPSGH